MVRRKDKPPFKLTRCNSHDWCFEYKRERERLELKKKIDEEVAKKKEEERLKKEEWKGRNDEMMEKSRREYSS